MNRDTEKSLIEAIEAAIKCLKQVSDTLSHRYHLGHRMYAK